MSKSASFILLAAAALTAVTAASIPRADSGTCASFESLLSSSDPQFSCLAPVGKLTSVVSSANATLTSAQSALNNWLTEFCAVPSCSTDTLDQVANLTSTCSSFNGTQFAQQYPEARELFCLRDTTNNTFCTTEALSPDNFSSDNSTDTTDDTSDTNPEDVLFVLALASSGLGTCSECTKAQYQVGVKFGQPDASAFLSQCGADFVASLNSTAQGIEQTAVTSTTSSTAATSKNGASSLGRATLLVLLEVAGFCALF
ncbi:hypothetical protein MSAN_00218800 [Mycena sanguinolenta]|uniref:Uncharacterized protein n=1 Tax=Mycena sanguinolenta TaxID=230812 RepID=A0A8H7DJR2_9AGAR|nr:hypothetical protein MSAN_00218800 [Mycena sanguinolenta]